MAGLYLLENTAAGLRMIRYAFILLSTLSYILASSACNAEKIYLKDGEAVQAKILSRDKRSVWLEKRFGDKIGSVGISIDDIDRIENDDSSISKYDYKFLYEKSGECIRNKDYKEAVRLYTLLLESFPDNIQIYCLRAFLNHRIGRFDEAIQDYKFCIKCGVGDVRVFNNLGVIYAKRNERKEALDWFSKAAETAPDTMEVHNNLAELFMCTKDYNRAIYEYKEVVRLRPDNTEAVYNLGIAYMNEGDYLRAREQWEGILAIRPGDDDARYALEYIDRKMAPGKVEKSN